ncbi:MAG: MucB/RseB C-terminal domain-containing protein [Rubrivivax sp.]|nr:MucB/RseB C-terminal domain-containing protein [Rubrivivax sp.]
MPWRFWRRALVPLSMLVAVMPALAGDTALPTTAPNDARAWLARMHRAAVGGNYQGTMVISANGVMTSSSVAHFCVGDQVFERIEVLDGKQRQVYRHNDLVHTVWPQAGLAVIERRGVQINLPSATQSVEPRALDHYEFRLEGQDRIAGREAQVFVLQPRDALRFTYRMWADQRSGLMLRSDIIGPTQAVLESAAFSEVEIGVRSQPDSVLQPIRELERLRVLRPTLLPTRLEDQGWTMARNVAGFQLARCVKRAVDPSAPADVAGARSEVTQAVFSDGLTHVSLFIEAFDAARHRKDFMAQFGATHSRAGRHGEFWVTAMGDVPPDTLKQFVDALQRRRP